MKRRLEEDMLSLVTQVAVGVPHERVYRSYPEIDRGLSRMTGPTFEPGNVCADDLASVLVFESNEISLDK